MGPAREAAREQPAGCVSGRCRVLCAAREPAPPARRSPPARRRRGGVWVSNAALPPWAAPGSVPPAASRPGGGCSCTGRGTDASSRGRGVFLVRWRCQSGPWRKLATAGKCGRAAPAAALGCGPPGPNAGGGMARARAPYSLGAHPRCGPGPDRAQKSQSVRGC